MPNGRPLALPTVYRPTMSCTLSMNCGSLDSLKGPGAMRGQRKATPDAVNGPVGGILGRRLHLRWTGSPCLQGDSF
jgi:hypothetical protein